MADKPKAGTQMEVPGMPARISDRELVEDDLNQTISAIAQLEVDLRMARRRERLLRADLARLPREL